MTMESPSLPPGKRTSFPNPTMVFVIIGIIVAAFVLFLIFHPTQLGTNHKSADSPTSQH